MTMGDKMLFRPETKLTRWKNEPDVATLKGDLESSKSAHDAQVSKITKWNNLLLISN